MNSSCVFELRSGDRIAQNNGRKYFLADNGPSGSLFLKAPIVTSRRLLRDYNKEMKQYKILLQLR